MTENNETIDIPITQEFLYYEGWSGNNNVTNNRASGAYVFRPTSTDALPLTDRVTIISTTKVNFYSLLYILVDFFAHKLKVLYYNIKLVSEFVSTRSSPTFFELGLTNHKSVPRSKTRWIWMAYRTNTNWVSKENFILHVIQNIILRKYFYTF